jgi:hypothetical protein
MRHPKGRLRKEWLSEVRQGNILPHLRPAIRPDLKDWASRLSFASDFMPTYDGKFGLWVRGLAVGRWMGCRASDPSPACGP